MIDNVYLIKRQSQVKALGNEIKLMLIQHLMEDAMTCQQLAEKLGMSKQKVHYNLKSLLSEGLIEQSNTLSNDKEKHYRALAHNFVIDFSLGKDTEKEDADQRKIIERILQNNHGIDLSKIAAGIVEKSIGLRSGKKLLIVSGRFNLPLVEQIQKAACSRGIEVTLLYRDAEFLKCKHEEFTLENYRKDYENFNRLLSEHDVYLYLNGESRYLNTLDPEKQKIQQKSQKRSLEIISENDIKVVMMPGLLTDSLDEKNIRRELDFWKALDVDYQRLRHDTDAVISRYANCKSISIRNWGKEFKIGIAAIFGEYGSFGESPYQSNTINLPGGEVLLLPERKSINGIIKGDKAYIKGKMIENPVLEVKDNIIVSYKSSNGTELIRQALAEGGKDCGEIALICIGTNYMISPDSLDLLHVNKSYGMITVYWGDNTMLGGNVKGGLEWQVQIENPKIKIINRS